MSDVLDRICKTKEQAHQAASQGYTHAQAILANEKPVRFLVQEYEEDRTLEANRYYWGACLKEISEQAMIGGDRYIAEAWHELFRRQFLGYKIKKVHVAGRKKATVIRSLKSTRDLKIKSFSKYIEEIQAFAVTELGVVFTEKPNWR